MKKTMYKLTYYPTDRFGSVTGTEIAYFPDLEDALSEMRVQRSCRYRAILADGPVEIVIEDKCLYGTRVFFEIMHDGKTAYYTEPWTAQRCGRYGKLDTFAMVREA